MLTLRNLAVLVVLVATAGCRGVSESELIGTWTLTDESRQLLPEQSETSLASLRLATDGYFTARELPGELVGRDDLVTGTGEWSLAEASSSTGNTLTVWWRGGQTLRLRFSTFSGHDDGNVSFGTQMYAYSVRGRPRLFYYSGDPDEGRRIEFYRE